MALEDRVEIPQEAVLAPLVRVMQEACDSHRWALVGGAAIRLLGPPAATPNLEFITTESAAAALAEMLDVPVSWRDGEHLAGQRLHFMRETVPVFVHANPTFHGTYDSLTPLEIPSLWDARRTVQVRGTDVFVTPLEWELLVATVLNAKPRVETLSAHLRAEGSDGRLLTRLMREGHVQPETEEAVWAALEQDSNGS